MTTDRPIPGEDKELYRRSIGFLNRAKGLRGLSPEAVNRIERRLQQPGPRLARRPLFLAATVSCVVLLIATLAVARVGLRRVPLLGPLFAPQVDQPRTLPAPRPRRPTNRTTAAPATTPTVVESPATTPSLPEAPALPTPAVPAQRPASPLQGSTPAAAAQQAPISEPSRPEVVSPRPRPRLTMAAKAAPARAVSPASPVLPEVSAPQENPVLAESRSFSAAIEFWHRNRDPVAALAALDQHERHFSTGHLQTESRLLRAEIFLAQGREPEGLALLDRMNLAGSPRARELLTVRGELRVKAGRCAEARSDLSDVLARSIADRLGKRAAEALSHCP